MADIREYRGNATRQKVDDAEMQAVMPNARYDNKTPKPKAEKPKGKKDKRTVRDKVSDDFWG